MKTKTVKLSPPSRFVLNMCLDSYLWDYTHDKDKEEMLKSLQNRIKESNRDEFAFTDTERQLLIDSIHGYWGEVDLFDLELKAHEYLIEKLQS